MACNMTPGAQATEAKLDKLDDIRTRKKEKEIIAFAATWVDLEMDILSAVSQIPCDITCYVGSNKNDTNELLYL